MSGKKASKLNANLVAAVEDTDAKAVAKLLAAGADPNSRDSDDAPVLLLAASAEELELVELLLGAGAEVDAVDALGMSPLMYAVLSGNIEVAERLIASGADVNHSCDDDLGNTVLTLALDKNELPDEPSAAMVEKLLRAGANPNTPNAAGWPPLHRAASFPDLSLIELLLAAGADVKTPRSSGYHAIDTARAHGQHEVVKRLLAAGSPSLEETATARMTEVWTRIEAWYAKHCAPYAEASRKAQRAAPKQLAALERALGTGLPPDLRAFLLRFGGGGSHPPGDAGVFEYSGMSVDLILSEWKGLAKLRKQGVFEKATPHELPKSDQTLQWTWWHPGWVPFARDSGGNLYCVDLAPGPEGTRGQVFKWESHDGPLPPIRESLQEFFEWYLEQLEEGRFTFDGETLFRD
ncbi:ankyrin repeat domain-containing protein [Archangium violaceum]|uniref:ankyrin repeat domain-containing protein n=1 Tax=Archangium violaceum TaxID=83451 RepID=UPI00194E437E|nr:ankyrin repeat domain-containing protein [Archangium violaceum]QRN97642.1 ankyrin repeat domain-containing protein [Archangium violaceum]